MSIVGCATIVALACGHAARATAPDADLATLTLNAEYDGTPGETSFNDGLIVTASGAGGMLSGPPGTSGSLPPGSYDLSVEQTDPDGDASVDGAAGVEHLGAADPGQVGALDVGFVPSAGG